jgi:hypothetical protein
VRREATPFHSSPKYSHFVFSFRVEIHNQQLLAPLTANHPTNATKPEHKSAVANNTINVRRNVSGRFNSVLTSTPEKPTVMTRTTSATRHAPGELVCDIPTPGTRQSAAATIIAAAMTDRTLESRLAAFRDSIKFRFLAFSMQPPYTYSNS